MSDPRPPTLPGEHPSYRVSRSMSASEAIDRAIASGAPVRVRYSAGGAVDLFEACEDITYDEDSDVVSYRGRADADDPESAPWCVEMDGPPEPDA